MKTISTRFTQRLKPMARRLDLRSAAPTSLAERLASRSPVEVQVPPAEILRQERENR